MGAENDMSIEVGPLDSQIGQFGSRGNREASTDLSRVRIRFRLLLEHVQQGSRPSTQESRDCLRHSSPSSLPG